MVNIRLTKCKELALTSKERNPNSFNLTCHSVSLLTKAIQYSHMPKSHAYPMRYKLSKLARAVNEEKVNNVTLPIVDGWW